MIKRKLNNTELESISNAVFKSEPLTLAEIDQIVAKPELFSLIQKRIQNAPSITAPVPARVLPARRYVLAWSGIAMTFAAAAALAVLNINKEVPQKAPVQIAVLNQVPDIADPEVVRSEVPPQPITGKLSADRTTKEDRLKVEKAIFTRTEPVTRPERASEPDTRFIPVSYTGDPDETSAGGQVIRVEMKRSSLFALGVSIPLENDDEIVKADLLIGRDGVTRAIRVVN